jgi:hypothetical protein
MLEFAIQYHAAIDAITAACNFSLCQCELVYAEWKVAGELQKVLKVSILLLLRIMFLIKSLTRLSDF